MEGENVETSHGGWEPEKLVRATGSLKQILLQMLSVTQDTLSLTHEMSLGISIIDLITLRKNCDNKAPSLCCYF